MAAADKLLDVWIVDGNTVYREVPFTVVTDWLQQGRLLAEDQVRAAGGKKWHKLEDVAAFRPYLPHPEPLETPDQAEALQPVDLGLEPSRRREDEDEDVDMIPLIDISLVLLIFFMMTASVAPGLISFIRTPGARHQLAAIDQGTFWVGIDSKSRAGTFDKGPDGAPRPWYSLGMETTEHQEPTTDLRAVLEKLADKLQPAAGEVKVRIKADQDLPIERIQRTILDLQSLQERLNQGRDAPRKLTLTILGEVSEPQGS